MYPRRTLSRRHFVGGAATALGYLGLAPGTDLWAREPSPPPSRPRQDDAYDALVKLHFNENPYGPSDAVLEAMNGAWKYANRYGYPDGDIRGVIAEHHGVPEDHVLLGAGSGEILKVVGLTYLGPGRKVIGVEPSYSQVYSHASGIRADALTVPLLDDFRQDIPALIRATRANYREVGFVYLCNPNNPTGRTVSAAEVRELLDGIPGDVPVLVDEAYHHFVEDPSYRTSVPLVLEGRSVVVTRTFSKVYGLAGMRLGYGIAPPAMVDRMRRYSTGTINALVKWGGVAALADTEGEDRVRRLILEQRERTTGELEAMGYPVIPSETNFFMVRTGRPAREVGDAFRERGIAVGRPFPPMLDWLRVSVGREEDMDRFLGAFKEILPARARALSGRG